MNQTTRNNHFVPQFYLQQWSAGHNKVWEYKVLVSHDNVPLWSKQSIESVAFQRDLYTELDNGTEIDVFESWIKKEFEDPVHESLSKVLKDDPLSQHDWDRLASFALLQDLRTPSSYINLMKRWTNTELQKLTVKAVADHQSNKQIHRNDIAEDVDEHTNLFNDVINVESIIDPMSGEKYIKSTLLAGRKFWIQQQRYHLTKNLSLVKNHSWAICRPARNYNWFTSDHPVVRLNQLSDGNYNLDGGWANSGNQILMPLSPRHLLYTKIGNDLPDTIKLPPQNTKFFQKAIAERTRKSIYSQHKNPIVSKLKPRLVNKEAYSLEFQQINNWHDQQSSFDKF